jgi:sulfur-oxidizing protein SoxZ
MAIGPANVRVPASAKRGEVIEIRAMVQHVNASGFRHDNMGKPIARHIVEQFTCRYNGVEVFRAKLHPAISTNPYFAFHVVADQSGEFVFFWRDDKGAEYTHKQPFSVA